MDKDIRSLAGGEINVANLDVLESFSDVVHITRASASQPQPSEKVDPPEDQVGLSWRVHRGVFQDALSGIQITPKGDWRLVAGQQARRLNARATAGLMNPREQLYMMVFDQPCVETAERCLAWGLKERTTELDASVEAQRASFELFGAKRELTQLRHNSKPYRYLYHSQVSDGRLLETLIWTLSSDTSAEQLWAKLPEGLKQLSLLDTQTRQALLVTLSQAPDHQRARDHIREFNSWLRGRYHHFDAELSWERPVGLWRFEELQSRAHLGPRDSAYLIEAPRYGLHAELRIINNRADQVSAAHAKFWDRLARELTSAYGPCEGSRSEARELAGRPTRSTTCTFKPKAEGRRSWTYQLSTLRAGGALIYLLSSAPTQLFEGVAAYPRESMERALTTGRSAGVVFTAQALIRDERFRYQLRGLPTGGELRVKPLLGLGSAASFVDYSVGELSVVSFALGNTDRTVVDQIIKSFTRRVVPKAQHHAIEARRESQPESKSNGLKLKPKAEAKAEAKAKAKAQPEPEAEARPETQPETQPEAQPEAQPTPPKPPTRSRIWIDGAPAELVIWAPVDDVSSGVLLLESGPVVYGVLAIGDETQVREILRGLTLSSLHELRSLSAEATLG